jgi:hypothetical protein
MRSLLNDRAPKKWLLRGSLVAVLAVSAIVPTALRAGASLALPASLDPDAARGLDDPSWIPPPGSIRVATLPSGLGALPVSAPGVFSAQEASGDAFAWRGHTTLFFGYCVMPPSSDRKYLDLKGCFKVRRLDDERDLAGHQYFGEGFDVFADGKNGWHLDRVKGRAEQPEGDAVDWAPGADAPHGTPAQVTVNAGWNGSGLSASWMVYPGRIHPWVGGRVFHSSWISQSGGASPGTSIQAVGATIWQFASNGTAHGDTGMAETWLHK